MLTCTNKITVSLDGQTSFEPIIAIQGDTGSRRFKIQLTENGGNFAIPAGVSAQLCCRLPNKSKASCDCEINDNGTVIAALTSEMLGLAGSIKCQVVLKDNERTLSSTVFPVKVIPAMCR